MKNLAVVLLALFALTLASSAAAQNKSKTEKPLVLESQGSFYVGGETKSLAAPAGARGGFGTGDITINQMYVQY
jgi:hypothetical protein